MTANPIKVSVQEWQSDADVLRYQYETVNWKALDRVTFPVPSDININMMPFVAESSLSTIPEYCRGYIPLIEACMKTTGCCYRRGDEASNIYYLTIQESLVNPGECQRRPGLHTDAHAHADLGASLTRGNGYWHSWGGGEDGSKHVPHRGGIFLASNVENSCAVWNCGVRRPGLLGDCEELRDRITPKYGPSIVEPNRIYWITDRTPHEALPLPDGGYRQFFRLVTEKVDVWYDQHSTPNPFGVTPPESCRIISENKFGVLLK